MAQLTKEERRERLRNNRNEIRARQRAESIHQQIEDIDLAWGSPLRKPSPGILVQRIRLFGSGRLIRLTPFHNLES